MLTLKIFKSRVKVRTFKEMLVSEYLALEGDLNVLKYVALQTKRKASDLMAVNVAPQVIHRIADIDINSLTLLSIKYKGKRYASFDVMPFGAHYLAETIFREKRDNPGLWIFAIALSFKVENVFDMAKVTEVYSNLLKRKAVDVVPVMNLFVSHYYKKKVFTIRNFLRFMKASPKLVKTWIRLSWSFIIRKLNYKMGQIQWGKN